METVLTILHSLPEWLQAFLVIFGAAKSITVLTPTQLDDQVQSKAVMIINFLLRVLNFLALNVGKDTNKDDPDP